MTSPTAEIFVFIPQPPQTSDSPQLGDKLDSQGESIFQAIGISYSILDRMIAHNASCANAAADFFMTTLMRDGWSWDTSYQLVIETDWQHRMYRAWSVLNAENRANAVELDYDVYQNYWPNLDFCGEGFEAEMERWISKS
ncbi:hypothetical protein JFT81_01495 [Pseudomonas sp. TH43]|uniref:hypothetical protein n=1 Tax=Pseudomonas sp. TH43 TaxID=2796407 RepID=UPI001911F9E0|nr:hypothetical protein [Pseudomonas sp. TH43]MBK5373309.1 hypothetical protein [Pseudomonas sp. TH43]